MVVRQLFSKLQPAARPVAAVLNPINTGIQAIQAADLGRKRPGATPAGEALEQLGEAFDKRVDQISPGRKPPVIGLAQNVPAPDENLIDAMGKISSYSSMGRGVEPGIYNININPNTDRSYLAHELGHIASDQTDIGNFVASARHALSANPMLASAIASAGLIGAGANAVLTPGDDDLATSMLLASIASTPTLIDEALATKNGLAIMDAAGMRANLGQRGRLAGGLLSYAAIPITGALTANIVGNQFDEDVTLGM